MARLRSSLHADSAAFGTVADSGPDANLTMSTDGRLPGLHSAQATRRGEFGKAPPPLFTARATGANQMYAVSGDGQRFLGNTRPQAAAADEALTGHPEMAGDDCQGEVTIRSGMRIGSYEVLGTVMTRYSAKLPAATVTLRLIDDPRRDLMCVPLWLSGNSRSRPSEFGARIDVDTTSLQNVPGHAVDAARTRTD